jgi:hypothetical protein
LAGKAANDYVGKPCCWPEIANVLMDRHARPMLSKNAAAEWINLNKLDRFKSAEPFGGKAKSANSAERVQEAEGHLLAFAMRER